MLRKKDILIFILLTAVFCIPVITNIPVQGDAIFHMYRLQGIKESIQTHNLPIYIYPYHNFEFGYASPMFYSDFFLLIPGLLYYFGVPVIVCYKFIIIFFAALGNYLMLWSLRKIYDDDYVVYIVLLLYCFAGPRISDIYNRGAISSFIAYSFAPLIYLSIYKLIIKDEKCWALLGLSFSLVFLSHMLSFLTCCLCFLLIIILNIADIIKKKKYHTILKAMFLGILLSAFFMFPFLEQRFSQKFWYDFLLPNSGKVFLVDNATSFGNMINSMFTYSNYSYGIMPLVLVGVLFIVSRFINKNKLKHMSLVIIIIILSSFLVWDGIDLSKIPFMYVYQFPYRLLLFTYFFVIYAVGELITNNKNKVYQYLFYVIACFYIFSYLSFSKNYESPSSNFNLLSVKTSAKEANDYHGIDYRRMVFGEYLPYTNSYDYYHASKEIIFANEDPYLFDYYRNGITISFETDLTYDEKVYMPLSWYKGYYYQELDENNDVIQEIECFPNEYNRRVGVNIQQGHHNYRVYYKGTIIQKISLIISFITFIYLIKIVRNKKKNEM